MFPQNEEVSALDLDQLVDDIQRRFESAPPAQAGRTERSQEADLAEFEEQEYLSMNPDVQVAVHAGIFASGQDHWLRYGKLEGRPGRRAQLDCVKTFRANLATAQARSLRVGQLPLSPPTIWGQIRRIVMKVIARLMHWYTAQIQEAQLALLSALQAQADLNDRINRAFSPSLANQLPKLEMELSAFRAQHRIEIDSLHARQNQLDAAEPKSKDDFQKSASETVRLEFRIASLTTRLEEAYVRQEELRQVVNQLEQRFESGTLEREGVEKALSRQKMLEHTVNFERDVAALNTQRLEIKIDTEVMARKNALKQVKKAIADDQERTAHLSAAVATIECQLLLDTRVKRLDAPADQNLTDLYVAFEEKFRGTRAMIKDRQREYLLYLQNAALGSPEMPILDIGCGRGEWLELLRESGLHARGVDRNPSMASLCRNLWLDVEERDAVQYLRSLPGGSLGAITALHIMEHLPFLSHAVGVIDEALRVLKPGGLLILETPNPQNIQVGSNTFYLDPTHLNPLPPAMLQFFVEARGFTAVEVLPLHPYPVGSAVPEDSELARRFNAYFYGAQDYAVIGRKTI